MALGGRFADLAARNPALWLVIVRHGEVLTYGAPPAAATRTVAELRNVVDAVTFRLPGVKAASGAVTLQRRETALGPVLIAAGGVDPATLSLAEAVESLLNPGLVAMLGVIAGISLLAMVVAIPFFSRALRPITAEADAIGPRDPNRRLDQARAPKELLPLVRSFNAALERLEAELTRRKQFLADIAHELRTPLAVISLRVDSLPEDARADLQRGVRGLTHLVSQMLDLERLSLSSERRSAIDLAAVAREVVADLAPMAIERGYELSLEAPDRPVIVIGDSHAIARAVSNIIHNALVHGNGAGQVITTVGVDRTIDVIDEGPGVPASLTSRLFEPFSRGSTGDGCGLGLHITREIMRSHGGEIRLLPGKRGAVFRLTFPPPHTGE
ncbi:MAG: HAMP domain-containing histidine kinase [Proteobacteria bacterium]|nr:HAMP domain-containing histidine kinase [Pseudomonadota bacterium]